MDQPGDDLFGNRSEVPDIDADVDHASLLPPLLADVVEGPAAVLDDVLVAEVLVCGEVGGHGSVVVVGESRLEEVDDAVYLKVDWSR